MGKVTPFRKKKSKRKRPRKAPTLHTPAKVVWQVAMARLPAWVHDHEDGEEGGPPYRPWGALALSLNRRLIAGPQAVHPGERDTSKVVDALDSLAETCGEWPDEIEVRDPELAEELAAIPRLEDIAITCRPRLAGLDSVLVELANATSPEGPAGPPPPTTVPGVTADHLRSFADAATRFHAAAPWRELGDEDVLRIESPVPDPSLRHCVVMGAAGEQFGLIFVADEETFLAMDNEERDELLYDRVLWSVSFWEPFEVDFREHDLWEDEDLPVVADGLIPAAVSFGPKNRVRRASPRLLAFFESVLIAVAESTVDELDSQSWQREVETSAGRVAVAFSLIDMTEATRVAQGLPNLPPPTFIEQGLRHSPEELTGSEAEGTEDATQRPDPAHGSPHPDDPREQAQDLAFAAMEARGRQRRVLARQAVAVWPDCADALSVLAEDAPDLETTINLLADAVAASERDLGPKIFAEDAGHFWGLVETRPYMRARLSLANAQWHAGRHDEALENFRELLHLNPEDNQGVRDLMIPALLERGETDEVEELLTRYKETHSATWCYTWALFTFIKQGDQSLARRRLTAAFKCNPFVPELLLDREPLPAEPPPYFRPGEVTEAQVSVHDIGSLWETTEGALDWLEERWDRLS